MAVGIPNTGMTGLPISIALGATVGKSAYGLEVLKDVTPNSVVYARAYMERVPIEIVVPQQVPDVLFIRVTVSAKGAEQQACIMGDHTHFTDPQHPTKACVAQTSLQGVTNEELRLKEVFEFAETAALEDVRFLLDGAKMNVSAAECSFANDYGHGLGRLLYSGQLKQIYGDTIFTKILSYTSGACDARMAGAMVPVMSNSGSGNLNYIKPEVGSTSELIYDLIDLDKLDRDMAMAIYIGIIHDTGVFQYSNTTPETMEKGAKLIGYGFDFARLIQETFYQKTYVQTQIMGRALMESIRFMDNTCIVSMVDRKTMDFYDVTAKDLEGIVNQLRNIKGISCAIFMYETDVLEYKVSLRSDEKVNVAEVAAYFGGGGHARAAGCTMRGTFHDCVNNLSLHIAEQMDI